MNERHSARMDRREALKWIAASLAIFPALDWASFGAQRASTLTDPNLLNPTVPWGRTLNQEELRTLAALCDEIIPADERSPSASAVKLPDFVDEWVSAPYPTQKVDKDLIREGLGWLKAESQKRFQHDFHELSGDQRAAISDDICYLPKAPAGYERAAEFFARVRDLTASGFFTTMQGMKDLQYVGNMPLATFNGAPPEVLKRLHLA